MRESHGRDKKHPTHVSSISGFGVQSYAALFVIAEKVKTPDQSGMAGASGYGSQS